MSENGRNVGEPEYQFTGYTHNILHSARKDARKTVRFSEQICPRTFIPAYFRVNMQAIVFSILQLSFVTRAVLKIEEYHSDIPQFQLEHSAMITLCVSTNRAKPKISNGL